MGLFSDLEIAWTPDRVMWHTFTPDERKHYRTPQPGLPPIEWRAPSMKAYLVEHWILASCAALLGAGALALLVAAWPERVWIPGVLFVVLAFLVLYIELQLWLRTFTRYIITPTRIIEMSGILSKEQKSIEWDNITDKSTRISYLGGLLGYGDIGIETANEASEFGPLRDVPEPREFLELIIAASKEPAPAPAAEVESAQFLDSIDSLLSGGGLIVEPRLVADPNDPERMLNVSGWRIRKAAADPPSW
jgi:membrane protein YdbS with pleckstrin-like domain